MPFSEPQTFTVNVTGADIAASQAVILGDKIEYNSLAIAMRRLYFAKQLPGQMPEDQEPQQGTFFATTDLVINNGTTVALCDAYCYTAHYAADVETAIKIALENKLGIKPQNAYTATLVKKPIE